MLVRRTDTAVPLTAQPSGLEDVVKPATKLPITSAGQVVAVLPKCSPTKLRLSRHATRDDVPALVEHVSISFSSPGPLVLVSTCQVPALGPFDVLMLDETSTAYAITSPSFPNDASKPTTLLQFTSSLLTPVIGSRKAHPRTSTTSGPLLSDPRARVGVPASTDLKRPPSTTPLEGTLVAGALKPLT